MNNRENHIMMFTRNVFGDMFFSAILLLTFLLTFSIFLLQGNIELYSGEKHIRVEETFLMPSETLFSRQGPVQKNITVFAKWSGNNTPCRQIPIYIFYNTSEIMAILKTNDTGYTSAVYNYTPGIYTVKTYGSGLVQADVDFNITEEIVFYQVNITVQPSAFLIGYVLSYGNNSPVANASVTVSSVNTSHQQTFTTGSTGSFIFDRDLPFGNYNITVRAPGYISRTSLVYLNNEGAPVLFHLNRSAVLQGRILDQNNNPIPNATVSLAGESLITDRTDIEGFFELSQDIMFDTYLFTAYKYGYSTYSQQYTFSIENYVITLDITLMKLTTVMGVLSGNGTPLANITIAMKNQNNTFFTSTNETGYFIFPYSNYTGLASIYLDDPIWCMAPLNFTISENVLFLNITTPVQSYNITGRVLSTTSADIAGGTVELEPLGLRTSTNETGYFMFNRGVWQEDCYLNIFMDGYIPLVGKNASSSIYLLEPLLRVRALDEYTLIRNPSIWIRTDIGACVNITVYGVEENRTAVFNYNTSQYTGGDVNLTVTLFSGTNIITISCSRDYSAEGLFFISRAETTVTTVYPNKMPSVSVILPENNTTLQERNLTVAFEIQSAYPQITYTCLIYINSSEVANTTVSAGYNSLIIALPSDLSKGNHSLKFRLLGIDNDSIEKTVQIVFNPTLNNTGRVSIAMVYPEINPALHGINTAITVNGTKGKKVETKIVLKNTGESSDKWVFTLTSGAGWDVFIDGIDSGVPYGPVESASLANLSLVCSIPTDVELGNENLVILKVTSTISPAYSQLYYFKVIAAYEESIRWGLVIVILVLGIVAIGIVYFLFYHAKDTSNEKSTTKDDMEESIKAKEPEEKEEKKEKKVKEKTEEKEETTGNNAAKKKTASSMKKKGEKKRKQKEKEKEKEKEND